MVAAYCLALAWSKCSAILLFAGILTVSWFCSRRLVEDRLAASALALSLATNGCSALAMLPLLAVPRGTAIRPMIIAIIVFVMALVSLLVGVPLSVAALIRRQGKRIPLVIVPFVLNLAVLPVGWLLIYLIAELCGLKLEG